MYRKVGIALLYNKCLLSGHYYGRIKFESNDILLYTSIRKTILSVDDLSACTTKYIFNEKFF